METGAKASGTALGPSGADGVARRASFEVFDPADGSVLASLPVHGPDDVTATVARARAAQPAWEALGHAGRYRPAFTHELGAMTSSGQVDVVEEHVRDAVDKGARVLAGGNRRVGDGSFFEPTVLVDVDHSMKVMREETFGPVIPVMRVRDADEAVRLANDSAYGLSASVFGERHRAEAVARRLESGACNVNDVLVNYLALDVPMGGWKESGIGSRWGPQGIRKYCRTESIVVTRFARPKSEPIWFPYTPLKGRLFAAIGRFVNARGTRGRLRALRGR